MITRKLVALLIGFNLVLAGWVVLQKTQMARRAPGGGEPDGLWMGKADARPADVKKADPQTPDATMGGILSLDPLQNPIVRAARSASPAVVAVGGTISRATYYVDPFMEGFFWPYFARPAEQRIEIPFLGSGILIDAQSHVVTNVHVIEEVVSPFVTLSDGRRVSATLLDKDNRVDIALLKADISDAPFAVMGDSDNLAPGEWVLAIGNPFGDAIPDPRPTVTLGVVSALHRNYKATDVQHERMYLDMIQTDAAINPGNSGGPLVNIRGEIVGINAFIVSRSGGSVGIGFAIPIKRVKGVVDEILQHGRVRNYAMDFDVIDLTPRVARQLRIPANSRGAVVREIKGDNGPAAKAGLEVGDIITQADQLRVATANDLFNYFLSLHVGAQIEFKVLRDGKPRTLRYTIEEYKKE
jgi:serine protease Do